MNSVVVFGIVGLIANRGVDFLRTAFDKTDRIPKAYWLLAAWAIGIGLAFVLCNTGALASLLKLPQDASCVGIVLVGAGFGSVAGFWHELLSALSGRSIPATTPKGLLP
jgi:hypothetical protein